MTLSVAKSRLAAGEVVDVVDDHGGQWSAILSVRADVGIIPLGIRRGRGVDPAVIAGIPVGH